MLELSHLHEYSCVENLYGMAARMYLVKRHRKWWAMHDIPKDVREVIGKGARFAVPLDTGDLATAERRATPLKVKWLSDIEQARKGTRDHVAADAAFWQTVLREADEEHKDMILDAIADERSNRVERAMERAGFRDYHEDGALERNVSTILRQRAW